MSSRASGSGGRALVGSAPGRLIVARIVAELGPARFEAGADAVVLSSARATETTLSYRAVLQRDMGHEHDDDGSDYEGANVDPAKHASPSLNPPMVTVVGRRRPPGAALVRAPIATGATDASGG